MTTSSNFVATLFSKSRTPLTAECQSTFTNSLLPALFQEPTVAVRFLDSDETPSIVEAKIISISPQFLPSSRDPASATTILQFETSNHVELVFQYDTVFRQNKRLAVFDMDSTLIQQEVIDEIARKLGVVDQVSAITERAMNGELDFTASLRERCALLKGVPATVFEEIKQLITLTNGAADLIKALKRLGYKTAVLSGGFTPVTSWQARQLGLDYDFANHLVVSDDGTVLTGEVTGDIVNAEKKRDHVRAIAAKEGILLEQVLCVGDGANDLPMMGVAGLGVAFNAKPKVQLEAPAKLNSSTLLDVLYLLGFSKTEQEELLATYP
jgi:phosphoserine phosphatase